MAKRIKVIPVKREKAFKNNKGRPTYRPSKSMDLRLTAEQRVESAKLFNMIKNILVNTAIDVDINSRRIQSIAENILGHIEFDIDAGSKPLEKAVHNSNMRGGIQKYIKFLS